MRPPDLSVIVSIYNRAEAFERGLWSWCRQDIPHDRFEIVVVDDGSTDGLRAMLLAHRARLRIQLVTYDRSRHDVYREINAGRDGQPPVFYHTPAVAHNLGARCARARVFFITQPEIIQAESNARLAIEWAAPDRVVFGDAFMTDQIAARRIAAEWESIRQRPTCSILGIGGADSSKEPGSLGHWYLAAVHRDTFEEIGGVDEEYMRGCYAEDDDFRERCKLVGAPVKHVPEIWGIHQDHSDKEPHRDRSSAHWEAGTAANRRRFLDFKASPHARANRERTWGALHQIVNHEVLD